MFDGLQILFSGMVAFCFLGKAMKAFPAKKKTALSCFVLGILALSWFPWVCWEENRRSCTDSEGTYLISTKDWNSGERCKER